MGLTRLIARIVSIMVPGIRTVPQIVVESEGCIWTGCICVTRPQARKARLAFLAWDDFHARSRFTRSTIPEEKWGHS